MTSGQENVPSEKCSLTTAVAPLIIKKNQLSYLSKLVKINIISGSKCGWLEALG